MVVVSGCITNRFSSVDEEKGYNMKKEKKVTVVPCEFTRILAFRVSFIKGFATQIYPAVNAILC